MKEREKNELKKSHKTCGEQVKQQAHTRKKREIELIINNNNDDSKNQSINQ